MKAYSDDPDLKPEVREVVSTSGNRTLRVFFEEELNQERQDEILSSLQSLDLSWEPANDKFAAIDVHPSSDYQAVCDKLWELERRDCFLTKLVKLASPVASTMLRRRMSEAAEQNKHLERTRR